MIRRFIGLCMGLAFLTHPIYAQSNRVVEAKPASHKTAKPLAVGDFVPNVHFKEVMNYPEKQASLSSFKAKLTILDFWSTSCTGCIKLFPHLQALQDRFGSQLNIVLVNGQTQVWHDNQQKIDRLLTRLKDNTGLALKLPIVLNCPEIDELFPYKTIPQEIWLNEQGKVLSITAGDELTEGNITAMIEGKHFYMHQKNDLIIDLRKTSLLSAFSNNPELGGPVLGSVMRKGFIDGLNGTGVKLPSNGLCSGFYIANEPLIDIYRSVYRLELGKLPYNQIVIDAVDTTLFRAVNFQDTSYYSKVYTYDLTIAPTSFDTILSYARQDLERYFRMSVRTGLRNMRCIVISGFKQPLASAAPVAYPSAQEQKPTLKEIVADLNTKSDLPILIDGVDSSLSIMFNTSNLYSNSGLLIKRLQDAGLEVQIEVRKIETGIISDH